jgi:predicted Zn-dependent protease
LLTKKTSTKHDHDDIKPQFDEALRLKEAGNFAEAAEIFLRLARQHPDVAAVHGMLGHVQQEMGKIRDAADSYRRAVNVSPGSELASISLFHALYKLRD